MLSEPGDSKIRARYLTDKGSDGNDANKGVQPHAERGGIRRRRRKKSSVLLSYVATMSGQFFPGSCGDLNPAVVVGGDAPLMLYYILKLTLSMALLCCFARHSAALRAVRACTSTASIISAPPANSTPRSTVSARHLLRGPALPFWTTRRRHRRPESRRRRRRR